MSIASIPDAMSSSSSTTPKPRDQDIDIHGLTHPGNVREANQDHFLISSLRREVTVHLSSLPQHEHWTQGERLALLAVVADGVGSSVSSENASRLAVEHVMAYVLEAMNCYYRMNEADDGKLVEAMRDAALRVHGEIQQARADEPVEGRGMATTLTLWLGVWPRAFLLQVGDSRCYIFKDDRLTQLSRDQTMAEEMARIGALKRDDIQRSPLSNILSSALGGQEATPVITRVDQSWGTVGLLCSDGLTKHVTDEQIAARLRDMTSAKQVCEQLLQDALDGGGTDNITIVVGRPVQPWSDGAGSGGLDDLHASKEPTAPRPA